MVGFEILGKVETLGNQGTPILDRIFTDVKPENRVMADNEVSTKIPEHIPGEALLPFNPWEDMEKSPHEALDRIRDYGPIVYSPKHHSISFAPNGCWMVTSADVAREVLLATETFSSQHNTGIPQALGEPFTLAPIESDPPEHTAARHALMPYFSMKAVGTLEGKIREKADGLIDKVLEKGHADFVQDFAKILPSEIFLELLGLPPERLPEFMKWEGLIMNSDNVIDRVSGLRSVADYLREEIRIRAKNPLDDVLSHLVHSERDGKKITESDALGTAMLLYIAGLDTVVNSLCWHFRHLAENPEHQKFLRDNPSEIPNAVEELMRTYSIVTVTRVVTQDVEFHGLPFKKGDVLSIPTTLASRDPNEYTNPDQVNFDRDSRRHFGFGSGPHICIGMHLARVELRASLELWLAKVPSFRIKDGAEIACQGGAVLTVNNLPLVWE